MSHILLVEDEDHLAAGIKYNLEAEGYRVTNVGDGPTAMKLIEMDAKAVDLVILDLMLPGMSGYDVCENLRAAGNDMPVLILSARTLTEDRTRAFDVGADQYLTKPFELEEFLSRINALLAAHRRRTEREAASPAALATYQFGDAKINFESFEVSVGDQPVRMTRLELKLLQYFAEHEGRVIPRTELLENVWNLAGDVRTRAPDQFIRRLRKIFEPDPARPRHFITIRDAGYRFLAAGDEEA